MSLLRLVVLSASLATCAASQNVAWIATGAPDRRITGKGLTGIGDINQDGFEDLMMVVDKECFSGSFWGAVWFVSGADGTRLRELSNYSTVPQVQFKGIAAAGDMNGDGVPDYAACQVGGTSVPTAWCEVRSGVDDAVLWSAPPDAWEELLSDIDLDGDGQRDLVVGNWRKNNYFGEVRAYAHGGALLYQIVGGTAGPWYPAFQVGNGFANLGDVDGDGRDDFVMACGEASGRGAGVIVSGATGQYLRVCYGELPGDGIGRFTSGCGDMDGDGYEDFAMGNGGGPGVARGVVRVFSGYTGQVLHQWANPLLGWAERMASRGVDLDGDGIGDVALSYYYYYSPTGPQGAVYEVSGRDGSQIGFMAGQPAQLGVFGNVGGGVSTMRPRVGERIGYTLVTNDQAIWGPDSTGNCAHWYGAMIAYRGLPRTAVDFGAPCPGNLPTTPNIGMSALGPTGTTGVRIHLSDAPSNTFAALLLGLSTTQYAGAPLPLSLDGIGLPGCELRTSIEMLTLVSTGTTGIEAGHAHLDVGFPVPVSGQGIWDIAAQWWVLGDASTFPGGMTQAIRWRH